MALYKCCIIIIIIIKTVPGLDTGPEELKEKQRSDRTLKKYEEKCELARNELAKEKTRNRKYYKKKTVS